MGRLESLLRTGLCGVAPSLSRRRFRELLGRVERVYFLRRLGHIYVSPQLYRRRVVGAGGALRGSRAVVEAGYRFFQGYGSGNGQHFLFVRPWSWTIISLQVGPARITDPTKRHRSSIPRNGFRLVR